MREQALHDRNGRGFVTAIDGLEHFAVKGVHCLDDGRIFEELGRQIEVDLLEGVDQQRVDSVAGREGDQMMKPEVERCDLGHVLRSDLHFFFKDFAADAFRWASSR